MAAAGFRSAALVLACAACATVAIDQRTFEGTSWRETAVNGHATPVESVGYRMHLKNSRFSGGFGCNSMGAEYRFAGNQMMIGKTEGGQFHVGWIMQTERDCSDRPDGPFEGWAWAILQHPMMVRFHGARRLTLSNSAGSIELERIP